MGIRLEHGVNGATLLVQGWIETTDQHVAADSQDRVGAGRAS
jgi:hypothetical protein